MLILYADDLVIISKLKFGLKNCLKNLKSFNDQWLLDINYKKTKILFFEKNGRKSKNVSFYVNNREIENVQEHTYSGIKITASGGFTLLQKLFALKAMNAGFI